MIFKKQVLAIFLSVLMVLSYAPIVQAEDPTELPDYTAELYTQPYDASDPLANLLENGSKISKDDTFYYVIEKNEMVSESGPTDNDVQEGISYRISLPEPLVCANTFSSQTINAEYIREDDTSNTIPVGTFSMTEGESYLTICFEIPKDVETNPDGVTLEWLTDFHLSFACGFDQNQLENVVNEQGELTMTLPINNALTLIIAEIVPPDPIAPTISKQNNGITQQGETTWTITYLPPNQTYTGSMPTQFEDTLPNGLTVVPDSIMINGQEATSSDVTQSGNVLHFMLPSNGEEEATISYKTVFAPEIWAEIFQAGTLKKSFTNSVQCYTADYAAWEDLVTDTVTETFTSNLLSKDSSDIDYDPVSNTYSVEWTISVRPQGQIFDSFILTDTMGDGLIIPENLADLQMRIYYPGENPDGAPFIPVTLLSIDENNPKCLKITFDAETLQKIAGKDFDLKYTTQVNGESIQNPPVNLEEYKNVIQANVTMENITFSTAEVSYTPENAEQVLLTHKGVKANTQDRTLTWETNINPVRSDGNWHLPSPNLTEIVYRDELPKTAWHSFGWTQDMRDATIALVKQNIEAALLAQGLSQDNLKSVTITEESDKWVLEAKLTGTGEKPITFQYNTYAQNPNVWAANKSDYRYENRVGLVANGTAIDNNFLTQDVFASGYLAIKGGTVLRKWPMESYDPTNKTLTWELFVNERAANLGEIKIEEYLPSGMHYVSGSARIGNNRNDGTITTPLSEQQVTYEPDTNLLTFSLENITSFCRIQFDVQVDVDQLTQTTSSFTNSAKLFVKNEAVEGAPWVNTTTSQETAKIVNQLLTKTSSNVTDIGGSKAVTYTVKLNPLGMDMEKLVENAQDGIYLVDTLEDGLVLDMESVALYEGVVEKTNKAGVSNHTYTPVVKQGKEIASPDISFDSWENQLRIHIPDPTKSYYLTYTAYVVKANTALDNQIMLEGSDLQSGIGSLGSANAAVEVTVNVGIKLRPPANKYFSVTIEKVDSLDASKLAGTEFGLYTEKEDESSLVARGITDKDGICVLSVPKRDLNGKTTVYVKEIAATDGYLMDRNWYEVATTGSTANDTIVIQNTKSTKENSGCVVVSVEIQSDAPLDPWEITKFSFLVYEKPTGNEPLDDPIYDSISPNRDGELIIDGLNPEKEYIIVPDEKQIPDGYEIPENITIIPNDNSQSETIIIKPEDSEDNGDTDGSGDGGNSGGSGDGGNSGGSGDGGNSGGSGDGGNSGGSGSGGNSGGSGSGGNSGGSGSGGNSGGSGSGGNSGGSDNDDNSGGSDNDDNSDNTDNSGNSDDSDDSDDSGDLENNEILDIPNNEILKEPAQSNLSEETESLNKQPEITKTTDFSDPTREAILSNQFSRPGTSTSSGNNQPSIPKTGVKNYKELYLIAAMICMGAALLLLQPNKKK